MNPMLERVILLVFGVFILWQVILPIIRERPWFPLFRPKWDADRRMENARQKHDEALAKLEVAKIEAETTRIRLNTTKMEAETEKTSKKETEQ
jgi:hypothetical protein